MHKTDNHSLDYRFACLIGLLLMSVIVAILSLGIVWVRQEKSQRADNIKQIEQRLETAEQKLRYVNKRYAQIHTPEALNRLAGKELQPPDYDQLVWMKRSSEPPSEITARHESSARDVAYELSLIDVMNNP